MARLSGLATEHHPQGPGDGSRRRKGRKSNNSPESSQGVKRAASPTVEPSKRKRVHMDDNEQLAREMEESVSRSQSQAHDTIVVAAEKTSHHRRRHSEPAVGAQNEDEEEDDSQNTPPAASQPARGRPTNAARRARQSMPPQIHIEAGESLGDNEVQYAPLSAILDSRTKRRLRRSHVSEEMNSIAGDQKEDKRLHAELRRQLEEKDKAIRDLEFQLEARRMGNIDMTDDRADELERELDRARNEIALMQDDYAASVDGESEALMLIDPNDPQGPPHIEQEPLPTGEYASLAMELSSQVTLQSFPSMTQTSVDVLVDGQDIPDRISERAEMRFKKEMEHITRQLAQAQGALRVYTVELQNLNIVQPGASADTIITELRFALETLAEELEKLKPGCTAGLTRSELLRKIPELFTAVLFELSEKVQVSEKYYQQSGALKSQYQHVVDLLARSEEDKTAVTAERDTIQGQSEEQQQRIAELEDHISQLDNFIDENVATLDQTVANVASLKEENENLNTSLERHQATLEGYRVELDQVTKLTEELQQKYEDNDAMWKKKMDETVEALVAQRDEEIEARAAAEGEAAQKAEFIEELEGRVEGIEQNYKALLNEYEQLIGIRDLLSDETKLRQETEVQVDEQAKVIEDLNEQIQDLDTQLETLRADLEGERSQHDTTKSALDEAKQDIADLEQDIHNAGIQANELRSKLFEVQQQKAQAVADLTAQSEQREAEWHQLFGNESRVRQQAEAESADYQAQISELEGQIVERDDEIDSMKAARTQLEAERDEKVALLEAQYADLEQKYAALSNTSSSTIATLQANITDLTNTVHQLRQDYDRISGQATALDHQLETEREEAQEREARLQEELHEVETEKECIIKHAEEQEAGFKADREAYGGMLDELREELRVCKTENERLEEVNSSLERRVEQEAIEMMNIDAAHIKERDALRDAINSQSTTIATLERAAAEHNAAYEADITEKTQMLEDLQMVGEARAEAIVDYEAQIAQLKEAFRLHKEDTDRTIDELLESQRKLQEQNETLVAEQKKRSIETLKAVQEMKVKGVEVRAKGVDLKKVSNGRIVKVSEQVRVGKKSGKKRSRRQWDSGFGMDENIENSEDDVALEDGIAA